jgi:CBS domain-containing protein
MIVKICKADTTHGLIVASPPDMQVRDIMKPARWTIGPDDSLARAERMMTHRRIHELLVVDAGALSGLLSERDVLDQRARAAPDEDWWMTPVRIAMQIMPATAPPEASLRDAIDQLARSTADVLPIVDRGFLIGQVTAFDLFEAERVPVAPPPHVLTVADAMTEPAVSITAGASLVEAARLMVDHQVRHLPVVEDDLVLGMLSDRDIRTVAGDPVRYAESREGNSARELRVRDAMSAAALTVHPHRPLRDVADELADERIGAIPVVDMDGKLVGIVSYVDALRALAS